MAGGIINSNNTSLISTKDLDKILVTTLNQFPTEYTQFTKVVETKDRYFKAGEITGLGPLIYKPEGAQHVMERIKQGGTKTVTFKNYSLVVPITEEARDWDRQGFIRRIPEFLATSAQYTKELTAIDLFLSGFVTTYRAGLDGKALFADNHDILDPWTGASTATFDNLLPAATLSASAIQAARNYFENMVNSKGLPVQAGRRILLIVGPALRDTAKLLLQNEMAVDVSGATPYTTNMNVNRDTMQFMVSHYLGPTHTGYYFIDLDLMDLQHFISKPFQKKEWNDPYTDNIIYGISGRWAFDFFTCYGVAGSAGV